MLTCETPVCVSAVCSPSAVQWPVLAVAALPFVEPRLLPELQPPASSSEAAAGPASEGRKASAQARLTQRRKNTGILGRSHIVGV